MSKREDVGFGEIDWGKIGIYAIWAILAILVLGYIPLH